MAHPTRICNRVRQRKTRTPGSPTRAACTHTWCTSQSRSSPYVWRARVLFLAHSLAATSNGAHAGNVLHGPRPCAGVRGGPVEEDEENGIQYVDVDELDVLDAFGELAVVFGAGGVVRSCGCLCVVRRSRSASLCLSASLSLNCWQTLLQGFRFPAAALRPAFPLSVGAAVTASPACTRTAAPGTVPGLPAGARPLPAARVGPVVARISSSRPRIAPLQRWPTAALRRPRLRATRGAIVRPAGCGGPTPRRQAMGRLYCSGRHVGGTGEDAYARHQSLEALQL